MFLLSAKIHYFCKEKDFLKYLFCYEAQSSLLQRFINSFYYRLLFHIKIVYNPLMHHF